jgi:hypothetical protein
MIPNFPGLVWFFVEGARIQVALRRETFVHLSYFFCFKAIVCGRCLWCFLSNTDMKLSIRPFRGALLYNG